MTKLIRQLESELRWAAIEAALDVKPMTNLIKIPGVMTREMIKTYGTERVYAPAEELEQATARTDMIPICMYKDREHGALDLPDDEVLGWALLWYEDGKVKTNLLFDPAKMTDEQLVMLSNLDKNNLSPAFRSIPLMEPGAWRGQPYDSKQTDIDWKHIAVVAHGRCSDIHGCGLYKDTFDGLEVPTRDKLTRCVELLMSKGHQPTAAEEICLAAYKSDTLTDATPMGSYYSPNATSHLSFSYTEASSMPAECVEKKMADGMSKEEAEKACAPASTDAAELARVKDALAKAQLELAEGKKAQLVEQVHAKFGYKKAELEQKTVEVLDALLTFDVPPGQIITDSARTTTPPKGMQDGQEAEDEEDPDYKPGLSKLVQAKYVKDADGNTITSGEPVRVLLDLETNKTERVT